MIACCVILSLCLVACGCGKSGTPPKMETVGIKGTVKLDGKPVGGAHVAFVNTSSSLGFAGKTDDAGVYQLQGATGRPTDVQGTYKVTISRRIKADGTPLADDEPPASPANLGAVEQMPAQYSRPDLTTLSANVGPEGGTFDFDMVSR